jgi:hypothetical protein
VGPAVTVYRSGSVRRKCCMQKILSTGVKNLDFDNLGCMDHRSPCQFLSCFLTNGETNNPRIEEGNSIFYITLDSYLEDGTGTTNLQLNRFWKGHVADVPREKFGASFSTSNNERKTGILVFVSMTLILKCVLSEILGP